LERGGNAMKRRDVLKSLVAGGAAVAFSGGAAFAKQYFPRPVDETLFEGINKVKDPANLTGLEKKHAPVISAPGKVKAGEPFDVEVVIGEIVHPMGPAHWIEYLQFNIGNEPAGTVSFRSHGYLKPEAKFTVVLDESLKGKTVSLVMQEKCNLHGIWENYTNVEVA
jgi:superoxide reductase